mmetsp:Transcript_20181/g.40168  ORF Transcript_20181/g.40168 Transcript_20181/m.40168 type:complete len:204 (-) Transcript_20181:362-973(-)
MRVCPSQCQPRGRLRRRILRVHRLHDAVVPRPRRARCRPGPVRRGASRRHPRLPRVTPVSEAEASVRDCAPSRERPALVAVQMVRQLQQEGALCGVDGGGVVRPGDAVLEPQLYFDGVLRRWPRGAVVEAGEVCGFRPEALAPDGGEEGGVAQDRGGRGDTVDLEGEAGVRVSEKVAEFVESFDGGFLQGRCVRELISLGPVK